MNEIREKLWSFYRQANAVVCVTTNGVVKKNGLAIMGRGCALEARLISPGIDFELGKLLIDTGNKTYWFHDRKIFTFPTKHHWRDRSNLELIRQSAKELKEAAILARGTHFYLPRPGCGNGGRDWLTEVKPILESIDFPPNVTVVHF